MKESLFPLKIDEYDFYSYVEKDFKLQSSFSSQVRLLSQTQVEFTIQKYNNKTCKFEDKIVIKKVAAKELTGLINSKIKEIAVAKYRLRLHKEEQKAIKSIENSIKKNIENNKPLFENIN